MTLDKLARQGRSPALPLEITLASEVLQEVIKELVASRLGVARPVAASTWSASMRWPQVVVTTRPGPLPVVLASTPAIDTPPANAIGRSFQAASTGSPATAAAQRANGVGIGSSRVMRCPASARSLASSLPMSPAPTMAMCWGLSAMAARNFRYASRWFTRQHSSAGRLGGKATCAPWANTSSSNGWLPRVVVRVLVRVQMH